jgi:general secretion pathway protein A
VQIVLVRQTELSEKLDSYDLRQLKQRIALHAYLQPLDLETTKGYIHCRLQLAGTSAETSTLFPDETVAKIHLYSRGIPRLINTISDNALITAFASLRRPTPIVATTALLTKIWKLHQLYQTTICRSSVQCEGINPKCACAA